MTSIPPNPIASIAQAHLSQVQRSAENDRPREADARRADRQNRLHDENREFVEDMAEAMGLKVDPDGQHEQEAKRKKRQQDLLAAAGTADGGETPAPSAEAVRARSAALLANPGDADKTAPPPYMLDIHA